MNIWKHFLAVFDLVTFGFFIYCIAGSALVMYVYGVFTRFSLLHGQYELTFLQYSPHAYKLIIFGILYLAYLRPQFKMLAPFVFMFFYAANEVIYNAIWFVDHNGFPNNTWYLMFGVFLGAMFLGAYLSRPKINTKIFKSLGWFTIPLAVYFAIWIHDIVTGLPNIPVAPISQLSQGDLILNILEFVSVVNLAILVPSVIKSK